MESGSVRSGVLGTLDMHSGLGNRRTCVRPCAALGLNPEDAHFSVSGQWLSFLEAHGQ